MTVPAHGWGQESPALATAVARLPRIGVHRWPVTLWRPARRFHPAGTDVVIAEEHGGFAYGGNKVRQVDALLGEARAAGATTVLTSAGPQSNLCRVVAAAARAAGLDVHLLLRGVPPATPSRNQILYELTGATQHWLDLDDPFDPTQADAMDEIAGKLRSAGETPAIVDVRSDDGGTLCALAASAIVDELAGQWNGRPGSSWPVPARIVLAGGAGNTAGGIVAGLAARHATIDVVVSAATGNAGLLRDLVLRRAMGALERAGLRHEAAEQVPLEVTDAFLGGGHGVPTPAGEAAQRLVASRTGIFLDPTYTGKAMAAVLDDERDGPVVFIHTGGGPNVFTPPAG